MGAFDRHEFCRQLVDAVSPAHNNAKFAANRGKLP
jgi:hypothetical protein